MWGPRTRCLDQIKSLAGSISLQVLYSLSLQVLYSLVKDRQRWRAIVNVTSCQSWQDREPTNQLLFYFAWTRWFSFFFSCKYATYWEEMTLHVQTFVSVKMQLYRIIKCGLWMLVHKDSEPKRTRPTSHSPFYLSIRNIPQLYCYPDSS